ncbi:hypothetical protein RHMOL_Rhmol07G0126400 [Rhododendron molle]|uniref:Uncharacterized protein n=1 Tax=Rhododendron molle TaxID=49168 RepID=A0ACC0MZR7_RHOML|nr:hypothetical protein RHMOL_Rhmol07G0126400 [Rhododendron molle]
MSFGPPAISLRFERRHLPFYPTASASPTTPRTTITISSIRSNQASPPPCQTTSSLWSTTNRF